MNIKILSDRNLIKQCSNERGVNNLPDNSKFYVGFDPTADSLHIGHLLPLITMKRLKLAGASPIAIIGGATARVGDPTGRTSSRPILTEEELNTNINKITNQINKIVDCEVINNKDFCQVNFVDFVFDIGKHFSVGTMLKTETFKTKLETGLSFLEFSYSLLQANDFLSLFRKGCFVQIGGSDQWANIIAGINLIHAKEGKEAFGITLPILEDSNGNKFGKSNGNAIWLDADKTSPFDFWQFWRNVSDDMVKTLFMFFTFLSVEEINSLDWSKINERKEQLADVMTNLIHPERFEFVKNKVNVLFGDASESLLEPIVVKYPKLISEILRDIGFASSRSEALRLIQQKAIKVDGKVLANDIEAFGKFLLEKGKKQKSLIEMA